MGSSGVFVDACTAAMTRVQTRVDVLVATSTPEQLYELIDGHAGIGDNAAEGTRSDLLVVGYDNPRMRFVAAEDHVAATLAPKHEAYLFQGGPHFSAGQVGRKFGHVLRPCDYAASTSTNSLPTSVGTGSPASRQSST
jgi:hypothetical protein